MQPNSVGIKTLRFVSRRDGSFESADAFKHLLINPYAFSYLTMCFTAATMDRTPIP